MNGWVDSAWVVEWKVRGEQKRTLVKEGPFKTYKWDRRIFFSRAARSESDAGILFLALRVYSPFISGDWLLARVKLYQVIKKVPENQEVVGGRGCFVDLLDTNLRVYLFIYLFLRGDWVKADHSVNSRSVWAVINTSISIKELNRLDWWERGNTKWGEKYISI